MDGDLSMTISEVKEFLRASLRSPDKTPVMLWGLPGIGKSSAVMQVCQEEGVGFIDTRLTLMDPTDLRGIPVPKDGKAVWLEPSFFPHEDGGIWFFDELPNATPVVQNSALQLFLDRQLGEYKLPDDWLVVAAGNPVGMVVGVHAMNQALLNRIIHIEVTYDVDEWVSWALKNDVEPSVINFIKNVKSDLLMKYDPKSKDKGYPTPRSWVFVSNILKFRPQHLWAKAIAGAVGAGAATEFIAYRRVFAELPNIDDILVRGKDIVPERTDVLYALITTLVAKSKTTEHFDRVLSWSMKIPADFAVLTGKMLAMKDRSMVSQAPSYPVWASEYKDVIL